MSEFRKLVKELDAISGPARRNAVDRLAQLRDPLAVPYLIKKLDDRWEGVRAAAAFALGRFRVPSVVPPLIGALKDENRDVRSNAILALGLVGRHNVPALCKALKDEEPDVRGKAVGILGSVGNISTVPALIEALRDEGIVEELDADLAAALGIRNPLVREIAAETLGKILERCKTIEEVESFGEKVKDGFIALKKEGRHYGSHIEARMALAMLMGKTSDKRDELASTRDILLDDKPKPPEKGKMYLAGRRNRNG